MDIRLSSPLALNLVALGALLAAGCEPATGTPTARADATPAAQVLRVVAVKPAKTTIKRAVEEPGQIDAFERTDLHAKISGYLRNIAVDIGSKVKKDEVLAELWVPELVAEREQKKALVEQANAEQAQAESSVTVAQSNLTSARAKLVEVQAGIKRAEAELVRWQSESSRSEQLVRENAVTSSVLDEMRSRLHAAEATRDEVRAQIKSAEAAVSQAQAELDKARSDLTAARARVDVARADERRVEALLGYAKIQAPYAGTIIARNYDTGHLTQVGTKTEPIFVITRSDIATITVDVPELFATSVEPGDRVEVRLQAVPGRKFEGKVTRTAWALDEKTRTIRTEIDMPNPEGILRPGLYAYATIVAEEHPDVLAIPLSAVVKEEGKSYCVTVVDGRAERKAITLGINDGTLTEVRSGVGPNDVIVKANSASLTNGQALEVTAVESSLPKAAKP